MEDILESQHATNRLEAKVLNSFQKASAWRLFFDSELDAIRNRVRAILDSLATLQPAVSSVRSVSSSAPSHSGTTTVDLFVAQEEVDVGSLQQSLLSLSDDLLSVELQLHRLHGSCEGLASGCSSLSERVDALHSSLASLCEKTEVISNYTQRVSQIFRTLFSESRTSLAKVDGSTVDVRKVYERVVEVEPLVQLAPVLKHRLERFVEVGRKIGFVQDRLTRVEQRQEELEKHFAATGEMLERVKAQMEVALPKLLSFLDS